MGPLNAPWHSAILTERSEEDLKPTQLRLSTLNKKGRHKRTHPVSDIEEALLAGKVKHQQEPHGVPKECRRQTAEPGT